MTSARLRALIDGLSLTQGEAARLLGVHVRSVRKWLAGENPIPQPVAIAVTLIAHYKLTQNKLQTLLDE